MQRTTRNKRPVNVTGVALSSKTPASIVPSMTVYMQTKEWEIVSHVPIAKLADATPVNRVLPGRLGCYWYPEDSVFRLRDREVTLPSDFVDVMATETQRVQLREGDVLPLNHMTARAFEQYEEDDYSDETSGSELDEEEEEVEAVDECCNEAYQSDDDETNGDQTT